MLIEILPRCLFVIECVLFVFVCLFVRGVLFEGGMNWQMVRAGVCESRRGREGREKGVGGDEIVQTICEVMC